MNLSDYLLFIDTVGLLFLFMSSCCFGVVLCGIVLYCVVPRCAVVLCRVVLC
jgi:hypothetical protein